MLLWDEWMQCDPVIQNGIIQKCLENLAGTGRILRLYTLRQWRSCLKSRVEESEIFPTISVQREIMKEYFWRNRQRKDRHECRRKLIIPGITRLKDRNLRICCTIWEKDKNFSIDRYRKPPTRNGLTMI